MEKEAAEHPAPPPGWIDPPAEVASDTPVWLGFSGGEDSLLLASLLAARLPGRLTLLHVHHRQIPADDAIARACRERATAAGWRLQVVESPVVPDEARRLGPEAAARLARRRAFDTLVPAGAIRATAHQRRDQAETLLLRLLRGTGPAGLGGMEAWRRLDPPAVGWLWRPLLDVPKAWVTAEAVRRGLVPVPDPLNHDLRLARAHLRQAVWPALVHHWPDTEAALARFARLARHETDLLAGYVGADLDPRLIPVENHSAPPGSKAAPASTVSEGVGRDPEGPSPVTPRPAGPGLSLHGWSDLEPPRRHALARAWLDRQGFASPPAAWLARLDAEVARAGADRHPELRRGELSVRRRQGVLWAFHRL